MRYSGQRGNKVKKYLERSKIYISLVNIIEPLKGFDT